MVKCDKQDIHQGGVVLLLCRDVVSIFSWLGYCNRICLVFVLSVFKLYLYFTLDSSSQLCVGPLLNHMVIYIFKFIVWRGNLLAVEIQFVHFIQWEWVMPFCLAHFPGQYKRQGHIHSPSLFSQGSRAHRLFQHERGLLTFDHCFFRRPFFHFLLKSPRLTVPLNFWLNARFCIQLFTTAFFFLWLTAQGFFCHKLLLKLPNRKLSISSLTHLFFLLI